MRKQRKKFISPYLGIDEDKSGYSILYNKEGDKSIILKIDNPVLQYSANSSLYYKFHAIFTNVIKILVGLNCTIQKQDIFVKKRYCGYSEKDFLSKKYFEHFKGRVYTDIETYLIITEKSPSNLLFTYDQKRFNNYIRTVTKVIDLLKSKGVKVDCLNKSQTEHYIKRYLAFDFRHDSFSYNNINAKDEYLQLGDRVVKNIPLIDIDAVNLPQLIKPYKTINVGYPFPVDLMTFLHQVPQNVPSCDTIIYNQVISIPDQRKEILRLDRKRKRHSSMPDPANELAVQDIDDVMSNIAKENQLLVYSNFNIQVSASEKDISKVYNYIEGSLFDAGILISKSAYNQLELYRCSMPGNSTSFEKYDLFFTTSDSAICLLFKESLPEDEKSKFQIFFCDRQGVPIAVDPSDLPMRSNRINNRNKFVLGPSGSGKSFLMNHLVRQYASQDTDVVLVDTGHSYSGLCTYYNGRYITYDENKPITMNPFRIADQEYNEEKRDTLKSLIGLLWKGSEGSINQMEDSVISTVIAAYYRNYFENVKDPSYLSFNSFYEYSIEKIVEICDSEQISFDINSYRFILKKFYKGGDYQSILNSEFDASLFDEKFIVFEIDSIKENKTLFPIVVMIIMDVFLQKMRHKKNRKSLIIEEAWKAIASPMMANYILYVYKTVRKFFGEAVVVTQELDDIIGNEIVKNSIINNSDTVILLDQEKFRDSYEEVAELLNLNEVEQKKIFTINQFENKSGRSRFKEAYIKRGNTGEVYGIEVSIYEYLTYTTERVEKEAVSKYMNKYGDFQIALKHFVKDLQSSGLNLPEFIDQVNLKFNKTKYHEVA